MAKQLYYHYRNYFVASIKYKTLIYNHVTLCNIFKRSMLSRLNILLHGALQLSRVRLTGVLHVRGVPYVLAHRRCKGAVERHH